MPTIQQVAAKAKAAAAAGGAKPAKPTVGAAVKNIAKKVRK
jgi:hypothetical protein